ncbi:hypothetical protein GCM10011515_17900 [Tsuneonella deserti]|uniref:Deacetylase PdaC domain-containing protein n=1 Tax=Tsuneonella deserti TaxID=2035528 RepID=A0ABQ1SB45_9SPHN|nr:DUF4163 domain-containing protein [Tsuneonella deserti]GGD98485.1 hypothetical protein GCM10011515_17900 [Tsuneonella deserti]
MQLRPFLPLVAVLLAGCSSPDEVREKTGVTATASQSASRAGASASAAASANGSAKKVAEDTDLYSYAFSYPAPVGRYPALAARLEQQAAKARAEMIAQAREERESAKKEGFPFHPHSYGAEWKVVADLPGYLSLSNEFSTYTGGAHGMYGLESLVWDKEAERAMDGAELFTSPQALGAAMGGTVCAALNRERENRRGEPVDPKGEYFSDCPGLDSATILVGSSNGKTFDRITVWFGPYVAGPYAEGAYELDFPMTAAMLGAVKPAYREAFGAKS